MWLNDFHSSYRNFCGKENLWIVIQFFRIILESNFCSKNSSFLSLCHSTVFLSIYSLWSRGSISGVDSRFLPREMTIWSIFISPSQIGTQAKAFLVTPPVFETCPCFVQFRSLHCQVLRIVLVSFDFWNAQRDRLPVKSISPINSCASLSITPLPTRSPEGRCRFSKIWGANPSWSNLSDVTSGRCRHPCHGASDG
jgi:hypothetical protein